ncbi:XdhC family protein [Streptomyces sp. NPDC050560]|uniref:XdhC family protein n=1 Tax=Streptomyces sp. NPDC050560 TaxID=3365630 RepID=UPI00378AA0B1
MSVLASPVTPAGTVGERVRELRTRRVPFVHATVVRAQVPSSAHPGDEAIVLADGSIDGFVGGVCAEGSVRTAALGTLADGGPLLLRVLPEGERDFPRAPGAEVVVNPCLSGGALEIFLRPVLPPPLVEVVGSTPIAAAVEAVAELLGYTVSRTLPMPPPGDTAAVVIAAHGRDEEAALRAALDAGVPHVALVASRTRGGAVLEGLSLTDAERARVHTPAGFDIGARTAPEVALSIMAEVVAAVRATPPPPPDDAPPAPVQAVDPVCGMTVTVVDGTPRLTDPEGGEVYFCSPHCRDRHAERLGA